MAKWQTVTITLILIITLVVTNTKATADSSVLPNIGGGATAAVYREERRLGQAWLRLFRRSAPISSDPIAIEYTENLLNRLAKNDKDIKLPLSLVIVKNTQLNAFAVPGGIIGVHTGLYRYAETEGQLASVLAHELAHLSQRHYARNMERQKGQQFVGMAALLASVLVAANSDGEAGMAALKASQGALIDRNLRYSRSFEEEADRLGLQTLVKSGYKAQDMVNMFQQMQRASRYYATPPEFLLTHPLTAKRIADIANRARALDKSTTPSSSTLEYDLVRARVIFLQEGTPQQAIIRFQSELKGFSPSAAGSRYGLVLSLIADNQFVRAAEVLEPLLKKIDEKSTAYTYLIMVQADIAIGLKQNEKALQLIQENLKKNNNSYALNVHHSQLQASLGNYSQAAKILKGLARQRPQDPYLWYHLAEFAGLSQDILSLHQARTEYFILIGDFDSAELQLKNILKDFKNQPNAIANAHKRISEVKKLRNMSLL